MPQDIRLSSKCKDGYNFWIGDVLVAALDFVNKDRHGFPIDDPVLSVWEQPCDGPPSLRIILRMSTTEPPPNPRLEIAEIEDDDVRQTRFGLRMIAGAETFLIRVGDLSLEDNSAENLFREYRSLRALGEKIQTAFLSELPLVNSAGVNDWYVENIPADMAFNLLREEHTT